MTDHPDLHDRIENALPEALAALPADLPPPPELDAAVLATAPPIRRGWPRWTAPIALAAGVLLGIGLAPSSAPTLTLTPGAHHIEGPATVVVPGGTLHLDGTAAIQFSQATEPNPGTVRDTPRTPATPEPTMFTPRDLLAAGSGAAVTIAILAGTGTWSASDASPDHVLTTGDALQVAPNRKVVRTVAVPPTTEDPQTLPAAKEQLAALRQRNTELEEARDALDFEVKALRGQLSAYGATATEWPDDLPDPYRPEPFTEWAESVIADVPGFAIAEVDCSEFPCLVLVESGPDAPLAEDGSIDWDAAGRAFADQKPPGVPEDTESSAGISVMETNKDGERSGVMVLYNAPDSHMADGIQERLQVRTRDAAQRLAEADATAQ